MKSLLPVLLFVLLLSSCGPRIKDAGYVENSSVALVSKTTSQGELYGVKYGDDISIPPVFPYFGYGINEFTVYFSYDKETCYLFEQNGEEVLSGKKSQSKTLDFEPLPIVVKNGKTSHKIKEPSQYYYGEIFAKGDYFLFDLADGRVCALFAKGSDYSPFGPYYKFVPGCSGYMFKDDSGKWGICAFQNYVRYGGDLKNTINKTLIAKDRRFDQVIEVAWVDDRKYTWLANDKGEWASFSIKDEKISQEKAVNQRLLSRVLNMKVQNEAKGYKRGLSYVINRNQRVGTKEASVVFL